MSHSLMTRARALILVAVTVTAVASVACSDDSAQTVDDSQSMNGVATTSTSCSEVAEAMAGTFPDFTLIEDEGRYSVGGEGGSGCRTLVVASAAELPSFVEVAQTLGALLTDAGWVEDAGRAADGPTGTITGFERAGELAIVAAGASPRDPSACASDEVISSCFERLDPSEIEIQGSITVANGGTTP